MQPRQPAGTVYGGRPPPRDRLLLIAAAVGAVGLLVGVLLATGVFAPGGGEPPAAAPAPTAPPASGAAAGSPTPAPTSAPTSPALPADVRLFRSVATDLCLEPVAEEDPEGADIRQAPCTGEPTQQWRTAPAADGSAYFVNVASGKCLDVDGARGEDQVPVQQWTCVDVPQQHWRLSTNEAGQVLVAAVHSGKCIDIPDGGNPEPGTRMQQFTCHGEANQRWVS
jgi:hypothetical protein